MIIDTQVHPCGHGWVTRGYIQRRMDAAGGIIEHPATTGLAGAYNRYHGTKYTPQEFHVKVMRQYVDLLGVPGDNMMRWLDDAGVDKCVVFGVDWAHSSTGEPRVTNKEQNKIHADIAKAHPDRVVALAALDPRRPDVIDQFEQCVEEWGMKGLKLHQGTGIRADDERVYPIIDRCAEYGLPVYVHTGIQPTSSPTNVARLASLYPQVKFVMGHGGMQWPEQAMGAAMACPNVYVGTALQQGRYVENPQGFYKWLRRMIDHVTPWKVIFESDAPDGDVRMPEKDYVQVFRNPKTDIKFTKEEMDIVRGQAALKVFDPRWWSR